MSEADSSSQQDEVALDNKFGPHVLPPCKVCGAQATGYHYGANTCEACKGFFHRSLSKKEDYICFKNTKCELKPGNRSLCPSCRYKRCVEVGMSKQGIKTGRYSYAKRTQDILELKAIAKHQGHVTPKKIKKETTKIYLFEPHRLQVIEDTLQKLRAARDKFVINQVNASNNAQMKLLQSKLGHQLDPKVLEAIKVTPSKDILYTTYKPKLSANEFISTGTCSDNEAIDTWVKTVGGQGGPITSMVNYIKGLPGFSKLPMNDQIQLIKHSMMEVWLIGRYPMFDSENKRFTTTTGINLDLNAAIGTELAESMCSSASKLQRLKIADDLVFVLVAFVLTAPDRCELQLPRVTSELHDTLLDTLLYQLYKMYGHQYMFQFAKIITVLTELRNVTHIYLKISDKLVTKVSDIPPLLSEILTLS